MGACMPSINAVVVFRMLGQSASEASGQHASHNEQDFMGLSEEGGARG